MLPMRPTFLLVSMPCETSIVTKYMRQQQRRHEREFDRRDAAPVGREPGDPCPNLRQPVMRPRMLRHCLAFPSCRRFSRGVPSVVERFVLPGDGREVQRLAALQVRHRLAHEVGHDRPAVEDPAACSWTATCPGLTSNPVVSMSLSLVSLNFTAAAAAKVGNSRRSTTRSRASLGDHDIEAVADQLLQAGLGDVRRLQLAGAQLPGDVVGGIGKHFLGCERDAAFEDGEDQHRERNGQRVNSIAVLPSWLRPKRRKHPRKPRDHAAAGRFARLVGAHLRLLPDPDAVSQAY